MEGVPPHLSYVEIGRALAGVPHVRSVHDLHVWYVSAARIALSAHVLIDNLADWPVVLNAARKVLRERFAIDHVTLQPDFPGPMTSPQRRVIPVAEVGTRRKSSR
jgi:cobalt-zinc-cadmium efflux system protein